MDCIGKVEPARRKQKLFLKWILPKVKMDGSRTSDFTSFSTVFQSYQDDGRMTMALCAMEFRLRLKQSSTQTGLDLTIARSVGQHFTN